MLVSLLCLTALQTMLPVFACTQGSTPPSCATVTGAPSVFPGKSFLLQKVRIGLISCVPASALYVFTHSVLSTRLFCWRPSSLPLYRRGRARTQRLRYSTWERSEHGRCGANITRAGSRQREDGMDLDTTVD